MTTYVRREHLSWQIQCVDAAQFPKVLRRANADGAITVVGAKSKKQVDWLLKSKVPVVNLLFDDSRWLPSILSHDIEIGKTAAMEFLRKGFRRFAFLGFSSTWCELREQGFADTLTAAGFPHERCETLAKCFRFQDLVTKKADRVLAAWITKLPKPIAIFAASDLMGARIITTCETLGLEVPKDVAVLGVDNIVQVCELLPVPMSSIIQDFDGMGFEAAMMLHRLLTGRALPSKLILLPPKGIVSRRSTDYLAFEDESVTLAMRLIHESGPAGVNMKELLAAVPVSRRWLDSRFKQFVGHSVSEEIRNRRLEHIRELLLQSDLPVKRIAHRCGFSRTENMVRFFRDGQGTTPHAYRVRNSARRAAVRAE